MKHYLFDVNSVYEEVNSSAEGLSANEAEIRLQRDGENKLKEAKKTSLLVRFLQQLADPMVIVLLVAAAISGVTSALAKESFADVIIILAVVVINAVLGVVQESKAEQAIEALAEMTASMSKVVRDGTIISVKSSELAIGDIIILEAGDSVPADCRIIEDASLKIEEAALTGESVPSNKTSIVLSDTGEDIPLGDRKNMAYMGSTVVYGRAKAVVVAIGMATEMGKIADILARGEKEITPLQKKLNSLSKVLSIMVLSICVFILGFKLVKDCLIDGKPFTEIILPSFMASISLAVAAIPEGLATVVTIVLSIGVTNMSKKNAVIRKLTAVETLGCAEIICSDKTGTLTQNKMTVVESHSDDIKLLSAIMALCSDATLNKSKQAVGEPTECALVNWAFCNGFDKTYQNIAFPRVGEAPFDSMRKMMSTLVQAEDWVIQYTKGAPDEVLKVCTHTLNKGKIVPLTDELRQKILSANKSMADNALRVLAGAYREHSKLPADTSAAAIENNLIFAGLVGMIDPVRDEVKDAIALCKQAGIRPIMITGDHIDTAIAIAKQLDIISDSSEAITGAEIAKMSDEEFKEAIKHFSVYARVQPEHKVRIVNTWKALGKVTAMTGDGVNDAPSIKCADIGVGMGITGTDVTKNTADMVLSDDNFATIVTAVAEGRRIYDNIIKAIQFLLSSNLSEVIAIFTATIMGVTLLQPVHLLWINLITDTFPALALGMEKPEPDIMDRPPRPSNEGIFAHGLAFNVLFQGFLVAVITVAAYIIGHYLESGVWEIADSPDGMTMAFLTMSMAEICHAYNVRTNKSIFLTKKQNKWLWGAMVCSLVLTTLVIYVPFLARAFEFTSINATEYFVALALAFTIIPLVEIQKLIAKHIKPKLKKA